MGKKNKDKKAEASEAVVEAMEQLAPQEEQQAEEIQQQEETAVEVETEAAVEEKEESLIRSNEKVEDALKRQLKRFEGKELGGNEITQIRTIAKVLLQEEVQLTVSKNREITIVSEKTGTLKIQLS